MAGEQVAGGQVIGVQVAGEQLEGEQVAGVEVQLLHLASSGCYHLASHFSCSH